MKQVISAITILVKDYDEAIAFYTEKLSFELVEDTVMSPVKRFVRVRPHGSQCSLLLAQPKNEEEASRIGNQTGGRVFLFLHTDDFDRDFQRLQDHKITIVRGPEEHSYGKVAVFRDLYGNMWDLVQPS